jgi:hypothetical protein
MSISSRLTIAHIFNVLKSAGTTKIVPLGRWKTCKNKNNGLIVDYSNIDHCGTCNYTLKNKNNNSNDNFNTNDLFDFEYIMMNSNTAD